MFFVISKPNGSWIVDNSSGLLGHNDSREQEPIDASLGRVAILIPVEFERDEDVDDGNWQAMTAQLAKALPGQKINLRINPNKLPTGVVLSDFEWVLPNKVFKDYEADQAHAKLTQIDASDRKYAEMHFYFADSGNKDIKVKCKVNGTASEFSTTLNVEKPTTTFTTKLGTTAFDGATTRFGLFANATSSAGIEFIGKVNVPAGWPQGKWHWVQLATPARTIIEADGTVRNWTINGKTVLDTDYPYEPAPYGAHPGNTGAYPTGGQHTDTDSPSTPLQGKSKSAHDSFLMTIMFLPDGRDSRYVPTRSVTWSWGATANLVNGAWSLNGPNQSVAPSVETTTHPEWTKSSRSAVFVP
jgi:hypothetical protein